MQVTCKINTGSMLSKSLLHLGNTRESIFPVAVGEVYEVFAMSLWGGALYVLLADESNFPSWLPLELFDLDNSLLPSGWHFWSEIENIGGLQALWGYEKLVSDLSHYDGLVEREPLALKYFYEKICFSSK